jgi:hypothetical protein
MRKQLRHLLACSCCRAMAWRSFDVIEIGEDQEV